MPGLASRPALGCTLARRAMSNWGGEVRQLPHGFSSLDNASYGHENRDQSWAMRGEACQPPHSFFPPNASYGHENRDQSWAMRGEGRHPPHRSFTPETASYGHDSPGRGYGRGKESSSDLDSRKVYFGGVPFSANQDDIRLYFSHYGPVSAVDVMPSFDFS